MASKTSRKKTTRKASKKASKNVVDVEPIVIQSVRGMRDILPGDQPYWQQARKVLEQAAEEHGFGRIDTPVIEFENIFKRPIGSGTDIVDKEMYSFTTKGRDKVALRPEMTAAKARAYIQHGMNVLPKPVKLFSFGSVYRYDRPQEGRYREFFQSDFDIFGEDDPVLDAQVIQIAHRVLNKLGIKNVQFHVNSIGTAESRTAYKELLTSYFMSKKHKLPRRYREMISVNPMRIFDAKDDKVLQVCAGAPQAIDHLDKESREHFKNLLEYLDELDLPYTINPQLVRGMDYYTRTVFEIFSTDDSGKRHALGGGGRYDGLLETFGGEQTPAIGFAFGIDRLILEMKRVKAKKYTPPQPYVFLAQLGDLAKKKSLRMFADIENEGILVAESFGHGNLKSQLRSANKLGVDIALIVGQKEALDGTVIVKNMVSGIQETILQEKIMVVLRKEIKKARALRRKTTGKTRRVVGSAVRKKVTKRVVKKEQSTPKKTPTRRATKTTKKTSRKKPRTKVTNKK